MESIIKCCVPGCDGYSKTKHVSFYGVKPEWNRPILGYINSCTRSNSSKAKECTKLRSNVICGRHFHLCTVRESSLTTTIYFPHLKISVERESQRVLRNLQERQVQVYRSEDIAISSEVTFPKIAEPEVRLNRWKKITVPKVPTRHNDHNYALSLEYIQFLKHDYDRVKEENSRFKTKTENLINAYEKEIERLKLVNHDLIKSNIKDVTSRVEFPFRLIADNEQTLKFYTGFSSKQSFKSFLDLIGPKYYEARLKENSENVQYLRKQYIACEEQLMLILCRLRLGLMHNDLAYRFNISMTTISRIVPFWTKLLSSVLVEESHRLDKEQTPDGLDRRRNKIILECHEIFFESTPQVKVVDLTGKKVYGRAKALIEVSANGFVYNVSDLFPAHISDKEIIESCKFCETGEGSEGLRMGYAAEKKAKEKGNEKKGRIGRFTALQTHIQRILGFIKGFKILKGTFPNSVFSQAQVNTLWKICCFLINFINKPLLTTTEVVKS
jgi:hypothetical protein